MPSWGLWTLIVTGSNFGEQVTSLSRTSRTQTPNPLNAHARDKRSANTTIVLFRTLAALLLGGVAAVFGQLTFEFLTRAVNEASIFC